MNSNSRPVSSNTKARLLAASALCLVITGCGSKSEPVSQPAPSDRDRPTVIVAPVTVKTIPIYREFVARTDASRTVDIRARVEGELESCNFKEGDFVAQRQVLFTIEPARYEAAVQAAKAQLAKSEVALNQAKKQLQLRQQQAQLAIFQSTQLRAHQDLQRAQELVKEGAISTRDLDVAVDADRRAMAEVDGQKAKISDTKLNQSSEIDGANAAIEGAKADLKQAQLNLSYCTIRSPLHGIIGRIQVYPGNLVGKGENTLLATISAVDPIKVDFSITEANYLQWMKATNSNTDSDPLDLILSDNSIHPYKGTLKVLDRAINTQTGTINVMATFPNPKSLLRPGQFGRVRAVVELRRNAVLIPQRSVQELQGVKSVLTVGSDDKVSLRTITVGPQVQNLFVVQDGLKVGERVIVEGQQKVQPGQMVTVAQSQSQAEVPSP